jgi:tetratricopeptide (TPR) repeat protein
MLALYTFRYYIKDLCNRLKETSAQSNASFRLYRGSKIHRNEVENLQNGCVVATNCFFSCSSDRNVAEAFISIDELTGRSPSHGRNEMLQFILFEIDVDLTKCPDTVIANVSAHSELADEYEMVFILGSTFIIDHIDYDPKRCLWFIRMRSFSEMTQTSHKYERYIRQRLREISSIVLFGHILGSIECDYIHSLEYFYRLLRTLPINHVDRPEIYHDLGRIYRALEKYEKALACFRCVQLLLHRQLPQRIHTYCRALGGIGSVYSRLGDSKRAINRLEQAITLQRKSLPDNHTEIAFHLNRLGYGYFKAKQFESALSTLYEADKFFQTRMPIDHQAHGETFHILGLVYRSLGNNEKAYEHFIKALRKRDSLSKDHPNVASTCYQLSLIHEDRGEYKLALEYAKRSLYIQSIKLPYYHSELKQSSELVERLQQRQRMFHTT